MAGGGCIRDLSSAIHTRDRDQWYQLAGLVLHGYHDELDDGLLLLDERVGHEGENAFVSDQDGRLWHAEIEWNYMAGPDGKTIHNFNAQCKSDYRIHDLVCIDPPDWVSEIRVDAFL